MPPVIIIEMLIDFIYPINLTHTRLHRGLVNLEVYFYFYFYTQFTEGASNSEVKLQSQSYYDLADQSLITIS